MALPRLPKGSCTQRFSRTVLLVVLYRLWREICSIRGMECSSFTPIGMAREVISPVAIASMNSSAVVLKETKVAQRKHLAARHTALLRESPRASSCILSPAQSERSVRTSAMPEAKWLNAVISDDVRFAAGGSIQTETCG